MSQLDSEQLNFFNQIADLAFVNPFSEQREQADCVLLNIPIDTLDLFQRADRVKTLVFEQLQKLKGETVFRITNYQGKTQETVRLAWLFYQYHQFQDAFNQFIIAQSQAGDTPIELPFAKELGECFQQAGFLVPEIEKYIALFYQLHRGFYFIVPNR